MSDLTQPLVVEARQRRALIGAQCVVTLIWFLNGYYLPPLSRLGAGAYWTADIAQWVIVPFVLLLLLRRVFSVDPAMYAWTFSGHWSAFLRRSGYIFITQAFTFFLTRYWAREFLPLPAVDFSLAGPLIPQAASIRILIWLYLALSAGIIESIFFVGLPWLGTGTALSYRSRAVLMLGASIVFGIVHWEQGWHVVIAAFASQCVAWLWFYRWKSLPGLAAAHAGVDLIVFRNILYGG